MAAITWDATTLYTETDVSDEITDISALVNQRPGAKAEGSFEKIYRTVKKLIALDLDADLPQLFVNTSGMYTYSGYLEEFGYDSLKTIKDKLLNPDVLTLPAVALHIVCAIRRGQTVEQMRHNGEQGKNVELEYWEGEYKTRLKKAMSQLRLDFNNDSLSANSETVRGRSNRWSRA